MTLPLPVVREGDPAPEFTLEAVGGRRFSLRELRGRPVLLIFLRHLG
jgi:peroxiredoxin